MKNTIFILLLIPISMMAQDKAKTWQVGLSGSPDYCYRIQTDPNATFTNYPHKGRLNRAHAGYTLNGNVLYHLSEHWAIEAGIRYSRRSFGSDPYWGNAANHMKTFYSTGLRYRYVEAPVGLTLKAGNKPLHFIGNVSHSVAYLLDGRNELYQDDSHKSIQAYIPNGDFRLLNMAVSASAGLEYSKQHLHFRAAPVFWYGLVKAQPRSVTGFDVRLWSAGLNIGCYYNM